MPRGRSFGCEFEFSTSWDKAVEVISQVLPKRNLRIQQDYVNTERNKTWWHLKVDGTTSVELATPISTARDIPKICKVISQISKYMKVTEDDGFHVHVDVKDLDIRLLMLYWVRCEKSIFSLVNRARKDNGSCEPLFDQFKKDFSTLMSEAEDHHSVLSTCYHDSRKTVEFRVAEGTRDPSFVCAWINFCLDFVDFCKDLDGIELLTEKPFQVKTMKMFGDIELDQEHIAVLLGRNKRLNAPSAWEPDASCKRVVRVRSPGGAPRSNIRILGTYGGYPCYDPRYIQGL